MLGFIAYLSSTAFFSPGLAVLLLPVAMFRFASDPKFQVVEGGEGRAWVGLGLIVTAVLLALLFFIFIPSHINNFESSIIGAFPYVFLILVSMFIGYVFKAIDFKVIFVLMVLEVGAGVLEYLLGVRSIFGVENRSQYEVGETDLLYFNRVYGFSVNSSVYALKVLYGLIIAVSLRSVIFKSKNMYLLGLLCVGLGFITSFNRTAIVAGVVFYVLYNLRDVRFVVFAVAAGGVALSIMWVKLLANFSRGEGQVDMSSRDYIFSEFWKVFLDSPIVGNSGAKVWLEMGGLNYHAHNSYLELLASNGVVVTLLFLMGVYLAFIVGRFIVALPFLVYSIAQYGLFWGISFNDVVFFGLMCFLSGRSKVEADNASDSYSGWSRRWN